MSKSSINPSKVFRVEVDLTKKKPKFKYFNHKGVETDGSADITEIDTLVTYTLVNTKGNLRFAAPIIEAENPLDFVTVISPDQQSVTICDHNQTAQTICIKLVVVKGNDLSKSYVSPDPILRSVPN